MNKVKWVWSSWLCFSGDCLICEQTEHFIYVGQSRVIRLSFATFQRPRGSPQGEALWLQKQLESQWWGRQDPLESVPSDAAKPTSFHQQNQVFPAEVVCASQRERERCGFGVLVTRAELRGTMLGCVCRTTWENGGSEGGAGAGGGGPWGLSQHSPDHAHGRWEEPDENPDASKLT